MSLSEEQVDRLVEGLYWERNELTHQVSNWKIATTLTFLAGLALGMLAMHEIVANGAEVAGPLF